MFDKKVINEIEEVFITELGEGSSFILEENLRELGMTRETFQRADVDDLVSHLLMEYNKLLGNHGDVIRSEIKKRLDD
jgi:hypothetical protein